MKNYQLPPEILKQVETVYQLRRQESALFRQRSAAELGTPEWDKAARALDHAITTGIRGEQELALMIIKLVKGDLPY